MALPVMFDQPIDKGLDPLHTQHGVEVFCQRLAILPVAMFVEIKMCGEYQLVGGVLQIEKWVVVFGPEITAGPKVAFDKQRTLMVVFTNGIDSCLSGGRPVFIDAVGFIHDVVSPESFVVFPALGNALQKVRIGGYWNSIGAYFRFSITRVIVDIEDDAHIVVRSLSHEIFDALCIFLLQLAIEFGLQALPHDRESDGTNAAFFPGGKVIWGGEEIICIIFSRDGIAGKCGSTDVQPDQVDFFCRIYGTTEHNYESEKYSFHPLRFAACPHHLHHLFWPSEKVAAATAYFGPTLTRIVQFFYELSLGHKCPVGWPANPIAPELNDRQRRYL